MDFGHHKCRDYIYGPHLAPTTITTDIHLRPHHPVRHESYDELEHRSRSPASFKPKFPLLRLPLELRQEILSYLLPRTNEGVESDPLARHARQFSAVRKREAKGMPPPVPTLTVAETARNARLSFNKIVWIRGNVTLLRVCRQLHDECAEMVYGGNTFLLFLTYADIKWRYRWLLPSGQAPMRNYPFLDLLAERYMRLLKRIVVHIDNVDAYTGMIKYNVSGKGLTHGLRRQVQRLANALKPGDGEGRELTRLVVRVSNSAVSDTAYTRRSAGEPAAVSVSAISLLEDSDTVLMPLRQLYGVREASVSGAVTTEFALELEALMRRKERPAEAEECGIDVEDAGGLAAPLPGLCVYGNDL